MKIEKNMMVHVRSYEPDIAFPAEILQELYDSKSHTLIRTTWWDGRHKLQFVTKKSELYVFSEWLEDEIFKLVKNESPFLNSEFLELRCKFLYIFETEYFREII